MHLESHALVHTSAQTYTYATHTYSMQAKENVETENSRKYQAKKSMTFSNKVDTQNSMDLIFTATNK